LLVGSAAAATRPSTPVDGVVCRLSLITRLARLSQAFPLERETSKRETPSADAAIALESEELKRKRVRHTAR
jgi:hypothetical protein